MPARLVLAATAVLAIACASVRVSEREVFSVTIKNANWYAHTVRLHCTAGGGPSQIVERRLEMGETRKRRYRYSGCMSYGVVFVGLGSMVYRYPQPTNARPGGHICIDIGPNIRQSFVYECTEMAEDKR